MILYFSKKKVFKYLKILMQALLNKFYKFNEEMCAYKPEEKSWPKDETTCFEPGISK